MMDNINILVVDDDPIILKSAERSLKPEGYHVEGALSGEEAIQRMGQNNYAIVFTDIRMPGIDGISLISWIRRFRPATGIVVITGFLLPEAIKEAHKLGVIGHMMKPFTPEMLNEVTAKTIERLRRNAPENKPEEEFPAAMLAELDKMIQQYKKKPGSAIQVLLRAQEIVGYLPPVIQKRIARGMNIYPSEIHGIVSLHSFFRTKPRGDHTIRVCLGTACYIKGSGRLLSGIKEALKIDVGETTIDRKFSLEAVPCVGPCRLAPLMVIDQDLHGALTQGKAIHSINKYLPVSAQAFSDNCSSVEGKELSR